MIATDALTRGTMQPAAVKVNGVVKSFGTESAKTIVLKGIDLEVRMGELLLLVGESGGGKTTLLSAIAGILDIDQGHIEVLGVPLSQLPSGKKTRFRAGNMGFIFQQFNLLPALTAAENVAVPLLIQGVARDEAIARARAMLERVDLGDRTEYLPVNLSVGQQQRVAIGRALVSEPRLLICDEPTASLDGENGRKVMVLLRDIGRSPGRAVIVVTHDSRIFHFGDRIAEMMDGRIVRIRAVNHANGEAAGDPEVSP
jgi:putative ABC transport system ATP-binding protein